MTMYKREGAVQRMYTFSCNLKIVHAIWHSHLFLYKHLTSFRVLGYASNFANFEITEINNSNKCLGSGCDELKVQTLMEEVP